MFSENLKNLRIRKASLARLMGVAPATVSRWGEHPPKYVWAYLNELTRRRQAEMRISQAAEAVQQLMDQYCISE